MINSQKGNIVILLLICILGATFYFLATLKLKMNSAISSNQDKKTVSTPLLPNKQETTNSTQSYTDLNTLSTLPPIDNQYFNQSVLYKDEILNPFDDISARELTKNQIPNNKPSQLQANNRRNLDVAQINGLVQSPNLIRVSPKGFDLPASSEYLYGYPVLDNSGSLNITINNHHGKTNLLVLLYYVAPLDKDLRTSQKRISRAMYVQAGSEFLIQGLNSGYYELEWVDLSNKKAFSNKPFPIYQDNKFAYDRVFNFNNKDKKTNIISIPLSKIYAN
ncbi:hypothetical protein AMD27_16570 (plasmid) [Acinetobacter sp. TGL-Y2]|uniref:hypothetical protein n=1 Tax=Acinetobacter sp. TGL-Y2 TaxID=1407071 RepID=UPI0007A668B4|nr:hypothetical protein [Acinetobacter sp. TGL-Y2]AMW80530.1 hypothetical protein AMD27_16570 [Acinetobacter sp. TGL-Y2]